jgi:ribA/ribD-fused uncharacterized protein
MAVERFTFFWRAGNPFSQWHPSEFTVNGVTYNCAEQYMMHQKALLFHDAAMAAQILAERSPAKQKKLGRRATNFNAHTWENQCLKIVHDGSVAKFTQNEELKRALLATAGTTLVEASPLDQIWGVGLAAEDPRILDRASWLGKNLLGQTLTQVREELIGAGAQADFAELQKKLRSGSILQSQSARLLNRCRSHSPESIRVLFRQSCRAQSTSSEREVVRLSWRKP